MQFENLKQKDQENGINVYYPKSLSVPQRESGKEGKDLGLNYCPTDKEEQRIKKKNKSLRLKFLGKYFYAPIAFLNGNGGFTWSILVVHQLRGATGASEFYSTF